MFSPLRVMRTLLNRQAGQIDRETHLHYEHRSFDARLLDLETSERRKEYLLLMRVLREP
jgi:hypothetical protein